MRYPNLVRPRFCTTPIGVVLYSEGLTEDGAPEIALKASLFCNWQDGAKTVLTKEQKRVEVSGRALFCGDICPELAVIWAALWRCSVCAARSQGASRHATPTAPSTIRNWM